MLVFEPLAGELDHQGDRCRLPDLAPGVPGLIIGEPRRGDADVTAQSRQGPAELLAKGDELLRCHYHSIYPYGDNCKSAGSRGCSHSVYLIFHWLFGRRVKLESAPGRVQIGLPREGGDSLHLVEITRRLLAPEGSSARHLAPHLKTATRTVEIRISRSSTKPQFLI